MPEAPTPSPTAPPTEITRLDLFTGYLKIGLLGFAGVAPWSRKVIVEERGWLSDEDYAAVLGFGQVLPGANTVNAAVIIGDRFQGVTGSLIAVCTLLAAHLAVLVALASLYDRFAADPDVRAALSGIAAGAAGLVVGTGIKMAGKLKPNGVAILLGGSALAAVTTLAASELRVGCRGTQQGPSSESTEHRGEELLHDRGALRRGGHRWTLGHHQRRPTAWRLRHRG